MIRQAGFRIAGVSLAAALLASCAAVEEVVSQPSVSLRDVQVTALDFGGQTFQLDFDIVNPNPFPLPIKSISYGVKLDGHRFASGSAPGAFTIPASSDGAFAINVDLDLLNTAPQLLFIVREGAHRDIPYSLRGELEVDIPFAPSISFENTGTVRLFAASH